MPIAIPLHDGIALRNPFLRLLSDFFATSCVCSEVPGRMWCASWL